MNRSTHSFHISTDSLKIFVHDVNTESVTDAFQVGDVSGQSVDHLGAFVDEFIFQVVAQVRVVMTVGQSVQVDQRLPLRNF